MFSAMAVEPTVKAVAISADIVRSFFKSSSLVENRHQADGI
jgi:hypothetical protein